MTADGGTGETRTSGKGVTAMTGGAVGAAAVGVGAGLAATGGVENIFRHSGRGVDAQPATRAAVPRLIAAVRSAAWLWFLDGLECLELGIADFLWQCRLLICGGRIAAPVHQTHITRRAGSGDFAFLGKYGNDRP
ncbi:MAG: hypothetical protein V4454_21715 [Pseudomonadota bacterium]